MKARFIFLSIIFLFCTGLKAQVPVYESFDCNFFKEIEIPFRPSDRPATTKLNLNQTVFYGYGDQFTYWYKIIVKENESLRFKISPLNDSDSYAVFVYQYNQDDFCKKLYSQKLKPAKAEFFTNLTAKDNPYELSEKKFNAVKNNIYYISVMNTSFNNCGHLFTLYEKSDSLRVKAVHIPCKRDVSSLSVKVATIPQKKDSLVIKKTLPVIAKHDTVKPTVTAEPVLLCKVKNKKTGETIDCKPVISETETQNELTFARLSKEELFTKVTKGGTYKIKCSLLGYKTITTTVLIENKDSTHVELLLEPLKEGDVFVMKSIYFHPNTYALKRESADELKKLLNYLNANETVKIEIQGHTNGDHRIGKNKAYESLGEEWNFSGSAKELSFKRAEAIKKFLETNGIQADRLVPKGFGGKKPIISDPQNNEEGQMNIRVEVVILKA